MPIPSVAIVNQDLALDRIEFIQLLKHTGDFTGQPFRMLEWQHDFVWNIYATVKQGGYRQYKYGYLEVPKKNGKTELVAAIALTHLFLDAENGEIYCCAGDIGQASLTYKAAKKMLEQCPALLKRVKINDSQKTIINKKTGTFIQVLSSEAYTKHGFNPTVVIFDELHAQPNRDLWDIMTFGAGSSRKEPLCLVITTAGDDPDRQSIGWEKHEYARRIRDGEIYDPTWYVRIYGAEEDDDIYDEEIWKKVNPSLGITIDIETVREEAIGAKNSPANEKLFRWLRLNQWVEIKQTSWLPLSLHDKCMVKDFDITMLAGKKCFEGLDLSSTGDLTARAFLFPPQKGLDKFVFIFKGYIPLENMREREKSDKVSFSQWVQGKFIEATPGDVVDYDYIKMDIMKDDKLYKVSEIGNDKWGAEKLRQDLEKENISMTEVPQQISTFSPVMKEIERLMKTGQIIIPYNPVSRWCFGNIKIYVDGNENYKPIKTKKYARIDLWIALFNAFFMYQKNKISVYDSRGVIAV